MSLQATILKATKKSPFSHLLSHSLSTNTHQFPKYVLRAPTTDVTKLTNGLRVASEESVGSMTTTVGVWIDAGSRYETEKNSGSAHFLEHLNFKGTEKRTQQQLEIEIENMGGHLNAYTSREQTVYFAKVFKKDTERAMEILSDILLHSKLDDDAIDRERDVILREMQEVNKQTEELVLDKLHETAFQGTGLGRTILGSEQNIRNLTRKDLKTYIETHYTAPRMVISAAGAIDHTQLCDLSVQYFGSLPMKSISGGEISMEKAVYTGSDIRMRFDSDDIAHISLAYEGASWTSKYAFPIMLLQTMLGSYDRSAATGKFVSSKLCQTVAEHELAHSITTFNTCYKDTGLFGVFAVAPSNKLDDLFWYVMGNLVRMVHNPTREELDRAKNQLKTCMLMNLDGYSNIAEDIGRQILTYGRRMTPAEVFCRIDAITLEDIKETARNIIHDQDHVLAAVGGIHELPDYQWFRRHSYYLRY